MQVDAELKQLFRQELTDRARKLVEGARKFADDGGSEELARAMYREGHTVKGTARVMGFAAIGEAGLLLETTWRSIQAGEVAFTAALGDLLEGLAGAVSTAIDADPDEGSPQLRAAMSSLADNEPPPGSAPALIEVETVHENGDFLVAGDGDPWREEPAGGEGIEGRPDHGDGRQPPTSTEAPDLGGLLTSVENWAMMERTTVATADLYRLVNEVAGLDVQVQAMADALAGGRDESVSRAAEALTAAAAAAKRSALTLAAAPLTEITGSLPQLVGYLSRRLGKDVRLEVHGDGVTLDRQVLDHLANPLRHLVANAIQHGIEDPAHRGGKPDTGSVRVRAAADGDTLTLSVSDDGAGVDWNAVAARTGVEGESTEQLQAKLFAPSFGAGNGHGNGLVAVAAAVGKLNGGLSLETREGFGTTITLKVPVARALQWVVLVQSAGHTWAIPQASIADIHESVLNAPQPVETFAGLLGLEDDAEPGGAVTVATSGGPVSYTVDCLVGRRNVAVKELGPIIDGSGLVSGAALLGAGQIALLVDPTRSYPHSSIEERGGGLRPRVLVVDDSPGARDVVAAALAPAGFDSQVAASAEEALARLLVDPADALVVDFSLPGLDGIELVKVVRSRFGTLPVVMLSAVADEEDQVAAKEAGVDSFFSKDDLRRGGLADELVRLIAERAST